MRTFNTYRKWISTCLCVVLIMSQQIGCTTYTTPLPPKSIDWRSKITEVGVVSARFKPEVDYHGFAKGKLGGAGKGALSSLGHYFYAVGRGKCQGEICGAYYLLILLGAVPVAAGGAVYGAVKADSAEDIDKAEDMTESTIKGLGVQRKLSQLAASYLRANSNLRVVPMEEGPITPEERLTYERHASEGLDAVLEIATVEIGTIGKGVDPSLNMFIKVRARLVRTGDGQLLHQKEHIFYSRGRKLEDWAKNNAEDVRNTIEQALAYLSEDIVDEALFLNSFAPRPRPKSPKGKGAVKVDSLQPLLRWETVSGVIEKGSPIDSRTGDISYDIRLIKLEEKDSQFLPQIVCSHKGLSQNWHQVEQPLKPKQRYILNVRLCFEYGGRRHVGKWMTLVFKTPRS